MSQWQQFFDGFAERYNDEVFTQNTAAEVEFLVQHLGLSPGARVLDVGCGTGRHSVGLAAHGFNMTGVDISDGMLAVARRAAEAAGVTVEWVREDATRFRRPDSFDAAICLCEGSMGLLTAVDDPLEHDMEILRNLHVSLRAGGRLILNVLNACRDIRRFSDADVEAGRYDIVNLAAASDVPVETATAGATHGLRERGYTAPELHRMLVWTGFEVGGIYGGTAGSWGLRPPLLDEYELMALARKGDHETR